MPGFAEAVNMGIEKILRTIDNRCYSIVWQLFTAVVHATPVLKGHLINSWFPKVGREFSSEVETGYSRTGSASLSRINAIAKSNAFYKRDGVMTMANNLDYSRKIEYEGWSRNYPEGMVRVSLLRAANDYRKK